MVLAAAGAFSKGTTIGAAISITVLNATSTAYIAGDADAAGAISVESTVDLLPAELELASLPDAIRPSISATSIAAPLP